MTDLLKGKIAVVTGGGRGIGAAICKAFAEHGVQTVVIAEVNMENAQKEAQTIRDRYGIEVEAVHLDIENVAQIQEVIPKLKEKYGRIDIWVNNAGIADYSDPETLTLETWDKVLDINLRGMFFCTQAIYRIMKEQNYGKIINIGSMGGERGGRSSSAAYSASKAGVIVLTKYFAYRAGAYNITCNVICPGLIMTKMADDAEWARIDNGIPMLRFGEPEDVAKAAIFYASDLSCYVTGDTIDVNGGLFMR